MHDPFRIAGENPRGFTLIEVMITVVVVAILAAIALPSYQQVVRKGNRADAKAVLMETSQFMERYFTTNNAYAGATVLSTVSPKGASGTDVRYTITLATTLATVTTPATFVITATPVNAQSSDSCGPLTIKNTGEQAPATAGCW
jgi:type IV pilus assembly protein PilE